jgi:N-acetylglucosamine-6-phosphate deacetylase
MNEKDTPIIIQGTHYETGKYVSIRIMDGVIDSINEIKNTDGNNDVFLAPGLIDNQINGYANVDFSGSNLTTNDIEEAVKAIWGSGVTTFLPTLLTNSHENLLKNFKILEKATRLHHIGDTIPGFHLEGPYISSLEGFRGCHPLQYIRNPSWSEFMEYQDVACGKIIQVTVAPELEGAIEFIRLCTENGTIVALGHTNATVKEISRAVDAGARLSTHLGNGCANMIHRHENPIWPQLANHLLIPSVIADGHHLTPEELRVFYKVKGPDNIVLTSDLVYLAGMKPGEYIFLDARVLLTEEGMLINPDLQCLAGASFPLVKGVVNMMKFTGCSLSDALKMATTNVTKIYGFSSAGKLAPGKQADIIMFNLIDNQINILETWKNGKMVFKSKIESF